MIDVLTYYLVACPSLPHRSQTMLRVEHCGPGTGKSQLIDSDTGHVVGVIFDNPKLAREIVERMNNPYVPAQPKDLTDALDAADEFLKERQEQVERLRAALESLKEECELWPNRTAKALWTQTIAGIEAEVVLNDTEQR